ncbi:MAG: hypothetical protein ABH821_06340 [archaeon]
MTSKKHQWVMESALLVGCAVLIAVIVVATVLDFGLGIKEDTRELTETYKELIEPGMGLKELNEKQLSLPLRVYGKSIP